jgi:hypothetical protein
MTSGTPLATVHPLYQGKGLTAPAHIPSSGAHGYETSSRGSFAFTRPAFSLTRALLDGTAVLLGTSSGFEPHRPGAG